ncbi:PREDICTED: cation/H(+) antiporter 28-like [Lupinus angustifolius]|uniref:cation/H(+) antiporter 28-like n=1 Tax=Lupinus angustifolius TaxID=3871 RepID=UPI00092F99BF|nr:PREDICTED: cation/H(+) antiporter 28-like [Lupinus angustifolius]
MVLGLPEGSTDCGEKLASLIFEVFINFAVFLTMVIFCNGLHFILKPYSQPRITSDIIAGLALGNIGRVRTLFDSFNKAFGFIIDFGMMCYMFALGIEMDSHVLFNHLPRQTKAAYGGQIFTFVLSALTTPFLAYFNQNKILEFTLCLALAVSSTASPVLTRLITHLKIGKSDIGKIVIAGGMHSDFIGSLFLSIGYIFVPMALFCGDFEATQGLNKAFTMACAVLGQTVFAASFGPFFMNWINNENPEGRPMKGSHVILAIALMVLTCSFSTMYDYSPLLSAFLTGVCLPREGRVSKWVITKINYILTTIFFPIFFLWMGYEADIKKFHVGSRGAWAKLITLIIVGTAGKIAGTVISGAMMGFHWPESVAIGLLLTTKGHLHIYLAVKAMNCGANTSTGIGMIIAIFFTVVQGPTVVANIIKRARKRAPSHHMALQLLDPTSELRILLCLHGPHNIPASINFMEISRGSSDPGILVYVADMIELTDDISVTLDKDEGVHTTTVKDKEVMDMRDKVTDSFQTYVEENSDGITLKRTMALSTINNMPQDICVLAEDLMIALIILPFHRSHRSEGTLDGGNQGFRYVNRKVLRSAPCSVGILVDRGLGSIDHISASKVTINVAVIFIGGKDDREALAYASRVARHPGVKVTIIRFLVDPNAESSRLVRYRVILADQENEMKLDDEYFAHFYERHVVGGRISYTEKHLANAAETFSTLRSFEGQYSLVIVGREGGMNSILTRGMNDWQQCPELGPIGDVLSGPDFSMTVSVLIIQQHKVKGDLDGLDDDFSIM